MMANYDAAGILTSRSITGSGGQTQSLDSNSVMAAVTAPLLTIVASLFASWRFYRASIGRGTRRTEMNLGLGSHSAPNDNIRYFFVGFPMSAIWMIVVYIVFGYLSYFGYAPVKFLMDVSAFGKDDLYGTESPVVNAVFIIVILYLVSIAPYLIIAGTGLSMNPKHDNERIEQTLSKYADEIRSGAWRPDADDMEY